MFLFPIFPVISSAIPYALLEASIGLATKIAYEVGFLLNGDYNPDSILLSFRYLSDSLTKNQFQNAPLQENFETYDDNILSIVQEIVRLHPSQLIQ